MKDWSWFFNISSTLAYRVILIPVYSSSILNSVTLVVLNTGSYRLQRWKMYVFQCIWCILKIIGFGGIIQQPVVIPMWQLHRTQSEVPSQNDSCYCLLYVSDEWILTGWWWKNTSSQYVIATQPCRACHWLIEVWNNIEWLDIRWQHCDRYDWSQLHMQTKMPPGGISYHQGAGWHTAISLWQTDYNKHSLTPL